jgi:hypothetical protein
MLNSHFSHHTLINSIPPNHNSEPLPLLLSNQPKLENPDTH